MRLDRRLGALGGIALAQIVVALIVLAPVRADLGAGRVAVALAIAAAAAVLVAAIGHELAGPRFALWSAAVWMVAPLLLLRYWRSDFRMPFRNDVVPHAFGAIATGAALAGLLFLVSLWLVLRRPERAELAGIVAGAAVVADPHVWPAAAAPVLALALTRDPRRIAAAAAGAAAGVVVAAVFRGGLPGISLHYHDLVTNQGSIREVSWSVRVLEYLPLAGAIGVARRSARAGVFVAWGVFALMILPFGAPHTLVELLLSVVPALPLYALLAASVPLLVPPLDYVTTRQSNAQRS